MRPRLFACAAFAFLVVGCSGAFKPKPPAFNLHERQGLVVLPFENLTRDPAVGGAIRDEVLAGLGRLKACPVAEQAQVQAMLEKTGGIPAGKELDAETRRKLADSLKCDIIMVGVVSAYAENLRKEEPRRIRVSARKDELVYRWGYSDTASVQVTASIKLIDAATGNVAWTRKTEGSGQFSRWIDLPWPGENSSPPADGWASIGAQAAERSLKEGEAGKPGDTGGGQGQAGPPAPPPSPATTPAQMLYQSDRMVFRAREQAVGSFSEIIIRDFTGTWGWQPAAQKQPR
jgi:TolB-like protein